MSTIAFSFLDYLSGPEFLDLSRRYAKTAKKSDPAGKPLSSHQNKIAVSLGFKNWSMLHRDLATARWSKMFDVVALALKKPGFGKFIEDHTVRTIDEDEAVETMKEWARRKYTPLIDFAFYDSEAENGFSWPEVDMAEELSEEFVGQYPDDLIQKVGNDLDVDAGPWGREDYGD